METVLSSFFVLFRFEQEAFIFYSKGHISLCKMASQPKEKEMENVNKKGSEIEKNEIEKKAMLKRATLERETALVRQTMRKIYDLGEVVEFEAVYGALHDLETSIEANHLPDNGGIEARVDVPAEELPWAMCYELIRMCIGLSIGIEHFYNHGKKLRSGIRELFFKEERLQRDYEK